MKNKCIFFGSSRIESIKALEILMDKMDILFCVGKKKDRDMLSLFCQNNEITCYENSEFYNYLNSKKIIIDCETLLISFLFQNLIRKEILNISLITPINFHPAPLPLYQGCACSCFFLYNNDDCKYGVTAHLINEKFDEGEIIKIREFKVDKTKYNGKTINTLVLENMLLLLKDVIELYQSNNLSYYKQNPNEGLYYSKKDLEHNKQIQITDSIDVINKKINSFWFPPYHGAYIKINGEKFTLINEKILKELELLYLQNSNIINK